MSSNPFGLSTDQMELFAQDFALAVDDCNAHRYGQFRDRPATLNDVFIRMQGERTAKNRRLATPIGFHGVLAEWIEEQGDFEIIQDGRVTRIKRRDPFRAAVIKAVNRAE